jgi:hypothetical protein
MGWADRFNSDSECKYCGIHRINHPRWFASDFCLRILGRVYASRKSNAQFVAQQAERQRMESLERRVRELELDRKTK